MKPALVLDIETNGREPWEEDADLHLVGWGDEVYEIPVGGRLPAHVEAELADPMQPMIGMTKYDWRYLELLGYTIAGPMLDIQVMAWVLNENTPLDLAWIAKRYANVEMDKRIKKVAKVLYFTKDDGTKVRLDEIRDDAEAWAQYVDYNRRDLEAEAKVFGRLQRRLDAGKWLDYFNTEEVPYTEVLTSMEVNGLPINLEDNRKLHEELIIEYERRMKALFETIGYDFNLRSGDQLAEYLYNVSWKQKATIPHELDLKKPTLVAEVAGVLAKPKSHVTDEEWQPLRDARIEAEVEKYPGFVAEKVTHKNLVGYFIRPGLKLRPVPPPPVNKKTGERGKRPSTATPDLMVMHGSNPFVTELVKWRKVNKILTTYTSVYPQRTHNGRLYGRFNQTGTKTGRLSSSGPNLQNQPAHGPLGERIRALFQGDIIVGDYSQLEPRLMAHFSGDPVLLDTYATGKDIYLVTASLIFGEPVTDKEDPRRQIAKTYILALGYGAMPKKLVEILALNGFHFELEEVEDHYARLRAGYNVFFDYREASIAYARAHGGVKTLGGRRRRLAFAFNDSSWRQQSYGERQAVNAVIQGSAGDIVRRFQVKMYQRMPWLPQLAQVHDEVLFDNPDPSVYIARQGEGINEKAAALLDAIRQTAETGHGFKLRVPLKFEPAFVSSWADKGVKNIILPGDFDFEGSEDDG